MNTNLNEYLSIVFRSELKDSYALPTLIKPFYPIKQSKDSQAQQFIVDRSYRLDLDEII
jgi:hypothetical protein